MIEILWAVGEVTDVPGLYYVYEPKTYVYPAKIVAMNVDKEAAERLVAAHNKTVKKWKTEYDKASNSLNDYLYSR